MKALVDRYKRPELGSHNAVLAQYMHENIPHVCLLVNQLCLHEATRATVSDNLKRASKCAIDEASKMVEEGIIPKECIKITTAASGIEPNFQEAIRNKDLVVRRDE